MGGDAELVVLRYLMGLQVGLGGGSIDSIRYRRCSSRCLRMVETTTLAVFNTMPAGGHLGNSATLSWSVGRHQLESRAAAELRNNGFEVSLQCIAPVWLKMLIGENHLSTFAHVVCISALETKPIPEDTDRCKRAVATMADNAKHLRWLQLLFLDSMPVMDADLRDIGAWTESEVVWLDGTQVTDAGREYIHDLPRLRFLSLDHTLIAGTGLQYLRACPESRT